MTRYSLITIFVVICYDRFFRVEFHSHNVYFNLNFRLESRICINSHTKRNLFLNRLLQKVLQDPVTLEIL